MLGPIPCDVTAGYDHITAAIGAAQSARYGADLICYITPAEHLALPNEQDVIEGVKSARTAAYIGDTAKYPETARQRDLEMAKARRDSDWQKQYELSLFPHDAGQIRKDRSPEDQHTCTMCGQFCANKGSNEIFGQLLSESCKA
jgi:phosphomethylpyrimidine synthase